MKSQVFDAKLPADSGLRESRAFLLVIVLTGIVMSISTLAHGQSVPGCEPRVRCRWRGSRNAQLFCDRVEVRRSRHGRWSFSPGRSTQHGPSRLFLSRPESAECGVCFT